MRKQKPAFSFIFCLRPILMKEHLRKQEDAKKHCEEKIREYIERRAAEIERHR